MALIINSNVASLNAQRQLATSGKQLDIAGERLASGKRINSAADDAAGLAISNRMTSQVRGLTQAVRNAMDGVSMIQVAEGALQESTNLLQRIRELSVQSSNGIYTDTDRATLDAEAQQLVGELNRISETTSFNGQKILEGSQQSVALQVGADSNQTITFSIPSMDSSSLGLQSTSGDLIGSEMSIDGNGLLSSALQASAVKINDQSISNIAQGATVQTLLDSINGSISGVTASTIVSVESSTAGDGVLTGSEAVNITGVSLDGTSVVFSITNTSSIDELVEKINAMTGGLVSAATDESGLLSLSSESYATMTVQDTTNGTATGINSSQIADPDIAEVVAGLTSSWIAKAEDLIETHFGIKGDGVDLTLDLTFTDGVSNTRAQVSASVPVLGGLGTNLTLGIDMADFTATGDESGGSAWLYMDRIIAHEMVHAVMFRNMNMLSSALPEWFKEGAAELIHGGDERVETDIAAGNLDDQAELSTAFASGKIGGGGITATGYSAGYIAVKMIHEEIIAAGGTGIDEVMTYLAGGQDISMALGNVATDNGIVAWTSLATFETYYDGGAGFAFMGTLNFEGAVGTETDTGAIHGSDYFASDLGAADVIDNSYIGGAQDFNLVIPAEYSGGIVTADAQLLFESADSDPITVTQGALGSDTALALLGLQEVEGAGQVLGSALDAAAQNTATLVGDIKINGVSIDAVTATEGLMGKIEAINSVSDEIGVIASVVAQQAFTLDPSTTVEYRTAAAVSSITNNGNLGLNGIGFAVTNADTAQTIAGKINNLTDYHGVTAYADDLNRLHLQADRTITFGDSVGGALVTELTLGTETGGSIKLNNTEVTLTDLTDTQTILSELNAASAATGVRVSLDDSGRFQVNGSSAIQVSLGSRNGLETLEKLGISFGIGGTEDITDTNANDRIGDETFTINARIKLDSMNDQSVSLELTANGQTATGFVNMNESIDGYSGTSLSNISIASLSGAQDSIIAVDSALESINDARSELGAINNRLEFTVNNLSTIIEKTAGARSRIVDTDYAAETARLSRAQVLQQASQVMVAQANQRPQQVLQLLQ